MKIAKPIAKSAMKRKPSKKTHKKSQPKKVVRTSSSYSLWKRLNDRTKNSQLVKHSRYVSRTECYIALYLSFYYKVIQQFKIEGVAHVFDIYIPKHNLVIEYDGKKWHKDKAHDRKIDKIAEEYSIKMLRIKEDEYYKGGKLKYVKKCMSIIDPTINTKHLNTMQKSILTDFWK